MIDKIDDEPVLWQHTTKSVTYVLTAKRALIVNKSRQWNQIVQQCALGGATATVINRQQESNVRKAPIGMQSAAMFSKSVGDVLFIQNGQVQLRFVEAPNPDSVIELMRASARQNMASQVAPSSPGTDSRQELELWSQGPFVATLQLGDSAGWMGNHLKMANVKYVLTNKRAYVIGTGGEGKVEGFGIGSWYKTAYNLSHPRIVKERIKVPKEWNGGIVSECNLNDSEPAIVNRIENARVGTRNIRLQGDIRFLRGGQVVLTLEGVEDPDGLVTMVRYARTLEQPAVA